ncbi:MAG: penicillin-binding transpeptidase domain-containing protein [Promicromonosporaceae bacterium]|nr:penicillin-binding transpeptidase domain-containing protein [Promicromonosporaceae bacterium]
MRTPTGTTPSPLHRFARGLTPRRVVALALTSALALPLVACSPDVPAPKPAVNALVTGLKTGTLAKVPMTADSTGDPQQQLTEILAPLLTAVGAKQPDVKLAKLATLQDGDQAGKKATATLSWSWPLGDGETWNYLTRAELTWTPPAKGKDGPGTWETAWAPEVLVPGLAPGERVTVKRVAPVRADVLDGKGEPLVTTRKVWTIGVDKTHVASTAWDATARELARIATAGGVTVDADAYAKRVASAGPKAFVQLVTVRQDAPAIDVDAARATDGVGVLDGTEALPPTSTFARAILGRSGEATAEIINQSKGRVQKGDITGLSGLQKAYDAQLAGTPGIEVTAANPDDKDPQPRELYTKKAVNGTPLQTTFDVGLQERAESVLAGVTDSASAIVAIQPSTGNVLAAASGPGSNGLDTAMLGKFAPGSTFKLVDALALGRKGVTPDTKVPCTPTITVNGKQFQNVPGYPQSAIGDIPFKEAIAQSCNTAMISQAGKVTQAELSATAADLGLGVQTPTGAGAYVGNVPTDATPAQHAATMIGQDRVEASPFAMARVAASIAAGKRVDPVLVRPAKAPADPQAAASTLTAAEAATLRSLMAGVVATGSATILKDVPGIVGAKTGTAQFGDGTKQHTWMIAIDGDLAVAVFVEVGALGSTTCGPLMHAFLTGH